MQAPSSRPGGKKAAGKPAEGTKVHTLRVKDITLESLLKQLGERLAVRFEYDAAALAAAGKPVSQRVSLDVKQVTLDELLRALLDPIGLGFQRNDATITITPVDKTPVDKSQGEK